MSQLQKRKVEDTVNTVLPVNWGRVKNALEWKIKHDPHYASIVMNEELFEAHSEVEFTDFIEDAVVEESAHYQEDNQSNDNPSVDLDVDVAYLAAFIVNETEKPFGSRSEKR